MRETFTNNMDRLYVWTPAHKNGEVTDWSDVAGIECTEWLIGVRRCVIALNRLRVKIGDESESKREIVFFYFFTAKYLTGTLFIHMITEVTKYNNDKGAEMLKRPICVVVVGMMLLCGLLVADSDAVRTNYPPTTPIHNLRSTTDFTHSFSPMEMDSTPDYPPYHGYTPHKAGVTWYDMQHNRSKGRNIAVDSDGGVHIAWMKALDEGYANRRVFYNYFDPDSGFFICSDSSGVRVDSRAYAGYCNIALDQTNKVPTVAFHDRPTSPLEYITNVAFDGTYYAMMGEARCGFIAPIPDLPNPWDFEGINLQAIWPKIAQIDTTVFMVSTPSVSDTTIGGVWLKQTVVFYKGYINPVWAGYSGMTFEPPVAISDNQSNITCDIAAYYDAVSPEVAIAWVHMDSITEEDTCFCDDDTQWPNLLDPAEMLLTTSSDMGETWSVPEVITEAGVHIYSDYPDSMRTGGNIDSSGIPWDTTDIISPCFSRPIDVNITYGIDGNIHLVWMGSLISPVEGWEFDCFGSCSVSVWCRSIILHWSEATGAIDTVVIDPIGYCNAFARLNYVGSSIEPQVAIDDDGVIYVCWEQMYSELLWDCSPAESVYYYDMADNSYENAEIFCSAYEPTAGVWTDPLNISNTYTYGCTLGGCKSELDMTLAERVDDNLHMSFILDTYPSMGCDEGMEDSRSLCTAYYLAIPTDLLLYNVEEYEPGTAIPSTFRLGRNFPNPFNAATGFWFDVYEPGRFTIDVIDMLGRTVSRVADEDLKNGRHHFIWDGFSDNGWVVPSGIYFIRARDSGGGEVSRKITLIK